MHLSHTKHQPLHLEQEVRKFGFSALQYRLFYDFISPHKEKQASSEKAVFVAQLLIMYRLKKPITKNSSHKWNMFLQTVVLYGVIALNGRLRNALTEHINAIINGRTVL
jgi:hypothetical protein